MTTGATDTLMRGFTTVRDAGGPAFGLKHAIDDGYVVGPRIYPSGALISQTAGHADARRLTEENRWRSEGACGVPPLWEIFCMWLFCSLVLSSTLLSP